MADNPTSSATRFHGWNEGQLKTFLKQNLREERARVVNEFKRDMKPGEQIDSECAACMLASAMCTHDAMESLDYDR